MGVRNRSTFQILGCSGDTGSGHHISAVFADFDSYRLCRPQITCPLRTLHLSPHEKAVHPVPVKRRELGPFPLPPPSLPGDLTTRIQFTQVIKALDTDNPSLRLIAPSERVLHP